MLGNTQSTSKVCFAVLNNVVFSRCILSINWISKISNTIPFGIERATEQRTSKSKPQIDKRPLDSHPDAVEIFVDGVRQQVAVVLVISESVRWHHTFEHHHCTVCRWRQKRNIAAVLIAYACNGVSTGNNVSVYAHPQVAGADDIKLIRKNSRKTVRSINVIGCLVRYRHWELRRLVIYGDHVIAIVWLPMFPRLCGRNPDQFPYANRR
ncbi:Uncharacterised protein [Klebsiella pneumoniae]|nr:Uncharacterised protein [Klebsiella pneumoniae]